MLKIWSNNKIKLVSLFLLLGAGIFGVAQPVGAGIWDAIVGTPTGILFMIVSWLIYIPIYFVGFVISSLLMPLMIVVANYNEFIQQPGVTIGWTMVRDLANMFIVAGILLIAIGTLLNIETYSYKKLLPKLILGAIAINFSKMIVGLLIDISQVITLTFVHAFSKIAAGNLIYAIGLDKILSMSAAPSMIVSGIPAQLALIGSLLLGVIMLVITAAVLLVLVAFFVGRIITIWISIVLSPLLFVGSMLPGVGKFTGQIWQNLSKQLVAGPMLAFFLWLSFTILSVTTAGGMSAQFDSSLLGYSKDDINIFFSQFGSVGTILNFILVIGLLMASLMMASQLGAAGGKLAGNLMGGLQKAGKAMVKTPLLGAGRKLDKWSIGAQKGMGIEKPISMRPSII
ncbi:MAG TPA: hypothetical protein P5267_02550, partial [Patescibacteria group bacterium]|nr:hypothetical protein [Patescibacteria group bacterium]